MADRIPSKYIPIVKNSLIAAAAVAPAGIFGGLDTVGVGATWAAMFIAIRNRAGSTLGADPKRICIGVASGIARYYIGCKAATFAFFLVPGVGPFAAIAAAIGLLIAFITSAERAKKKVAELYAEIYNRNENVSKVQDLVKEFDELDKKIVKTTEDYQRLESLRQQISESASPNIFNLSGSIDPDLYEA